MYRKEKLQDNVDEINCRVCSNDQETVSHIRCGCSKLAQTLYKNKHDRMLRPLYHSILEKYEFSVSENSLPWYKQSHPVPCLENDKVKALWDIPWHLEMVHNRTTVCMPGTIPARMFKRDRYVDLRLGKKSLYPGHKVSSMQVVFDFLAAHSINLAKEFCKIRRRRNG